MKWGFPHFDHKGILCSMAAFKQHCTLGFWKATLMKDADELLTKVGDTNMCRFEKITSTKELPSDRILISYIKEAARLNDEGVKLPTKQKKTFKGDIIIPDALGIAMKRNKKALTTFNEFRSGHQREYIEWINEAKTEATHEKRVETTIEWLSQGKNMHWKYQK